MKKYVFEASFRSNEGSNHLPDIPLMEIVSQSVIVDSKRKVSWLIYCPYNPSETIITGIDDVCDNCHHRGHIRDTSIADQCYPHTTHTRSQWNPSGPGYNAIVFLKDEGQRGDAICPNFGRKFEQKNTRN